MIDAAMALHSGPYDNVFPKTPIINKSVEDNIAVSADILGV